MLPAPLQFVAAVIFVVVESFLSSVIKNVVCGWWDLHDIRPWMSQDDVLVIVTLLVVLMGIFWMKERTRLNGFLIGLVSVLVPIFVCLNVWHLG